MDNMNEHDYKLNFSQLEYLMGSIVKIFKKSMDISLARGESSLELKFNLEFKESFEPSFVKKYEEVKPIVDFVSECNKRKIKLTMKLKGLDKLIMKASW
jgi:hypothetical protein